MSMISALQRAQATGRWSYSVVPIQAQGTGLPFTQGDFLYTNMPAWYARAWSINLNAMRYTGGNLTFGNAQPTDNQVDVTPLYRARVEWGVDGSTESVLVDYPPSGCTLHVQGAFVRVGLLTVNQIPAFGQPVPKLSGFICPSPTVIGPIVAPTLTTELVTVPAIGSVRVPVPARATAYRFAPSPGAIAVAAFTMSQESSANIKIRDAVYPSVVSTSPAQEDQQGNRAGYYSLGPQTQFIFMQGSGAGGGGQGYLQFLLDLG